MEILSFDLVIIGGGGAGLRAAIAAAETNQKLKIALISKVYPVRSHTVSAEGGIAGVLREYDSLDSHAFDTIRGSDYLADQDAVEYFVQHAGREIIQLEHWGCPWSREEDGKIAVRAFGGMSVRRTVYAADKTGFYMLHSLFERSLKYENIVRFDEWFATKLVRGEHGISGAVAFHLPTGRFAGFRAKAIILATGGAGRLFSFTTNGGIKTGDGMALSLDAGAHLKDMEFIQFHPTGLPRTGILITEAARGEGGYLLNNKGERFMKNYLPSKMELGPRDIVSRSIMSEIKAGRAFSGPYGPYVHLDIRHLGAKLINERLPLVREISLEFAGVDPIVEPIPITPVMHYFMGGIQTDISGATTVPGLFAAGETACATINGANRLGSNSLAECLVFGQASGKAAAAFCETGRQSSFSDSHVADEVQRIEELKFREGTESVGEVRTQLQKIMQESAGIERDAVSLKKGLDSLAAVRQRARAISLSDKSAIFNTDLTGLLELQNMLSLAEAVLKSALGRRESRGSHLRTDFPARNDKDFLHHHIVRKTEHDTMEVTTQPVTITQWKPQPRQY